MLIIDEILSNRTFRLTKRIIFVRELLQPRDRIETEADLEIGNPAGDDGFVYSVPSRGLRFLLQ